ncbi:hypothetical protein GCM10022221_19180 [Actinocorallia aurea]
MDVYTAMGIAPDLAPDPVPELPSWCRDELAHRANIRRRADLALRVAASTALLSGSAVLFWTFVLDPPPTPAATRAASARPSADRTEQGPPVVVDYTPTEPSRPNPVLPTLVDAPAEPPGGPIIIDAFPDDSVDPGDPPVALPKRPPVREGDRPKPPSFPRPRASAPAEPAPAPRATHEQTRPAQPVRKPKKKKRRYLTADEECMRTYKDPRLLLSCLKLFDSGMRLVRSGEAADEAPLPGGLHGTRVIARADVGDGLLRENPVEDRQAGEREARPPHTAAAADLDATVGGALVGEAESGAGVRGI